MDVNPEDYESFDELVVYCRRVAGSIGRLCLAIFGSSDPRHASELADDLGVAMQLTNILRDVREDHENGRLYLPREDLVRFACESFPNGSEEARLGPDRLRGRSRARVVRARPRAGAAARHAQRLVRARDDRDLPAPARADRRVARAGHARARVPAGLGEGLGRRPQPRGGGSVSRRTAIVVGGGLAGITAALDLADAGVASHAARGTPAARRRRLLVRARRARGGQRPARLPALLHRTTGRSCGRLGVEDDTLLQERLSIPVLAPDGHPRGAPPQRPEGPAASGALAGHLPVPVPRRAASRRARVALALSRLDLTTGHSTTRASATGCDERGESPAAVDALWNLIALPTLNLPAGRGVARARRDGVPDRPPVERRGRRRGLRARAAVATPWRRRPSAPSATPAWRCASRAAPAVARAEADRRRDGRQRRRHPGGRRGRAGRAARARAGAPARGVVSERVEELGSSPDRQPARDLRPPRDRRSTFAAGVRTPVQWVFDRTESSGLTSAASTSPSRCPAPSARWTGRTASCARSSCPRSSRLLPAARGRRSMDFFVVRENAATFRARLPARRRARPGTGHAHDGPVPGRRLDRHRAGPPRWRARCAAATPPRGRCSASPDAQTAGGDGGGMRAEGAHGRSRSGLGRRCPDSR